MKIIREVNGKNVEIELTKDELFSAYCEQEREFDYASCDDYLEENYRDKEWYAVLTVEQRENLVGEAASELRININKYDMDFEYAISEAFTRAIERCVNYGEKEENS